MQLIMKLRQNSSKLCSVVVLYFSFTYETEIESLIFTFQVSGSKVHLKYFITKIGTPTKSLKLYIVVLCTLGLLMKTRLKDTIILSKSQIHKYT